MPDPQMPTMCAEQLEPVGVLSAVRARRIKLDILVEGALVERSLVESSASAQPAALRTAYDGGDHR
jgi:hypothetical protein